MPASQPPPVAVDTAGGPHANQSLCAAPWRSRSAGVYRGQSEPPVREDLWDCVRLFFFLGFLSAFPFFFFSFFFSLSFFFFLLLWCCLDEEEEEEEELSESEEVVSWSSC